MKALIIDDEIDICYLLSGILRNKNIQSNYVNSLSEAVQALKKYDPEIIFLDNHLPDGMGVDFISQLKKKPSFFKSDHDHCLRYTCRQAQGTC